MDRLDKIVLELDTQIERIADAILSSDSDVVTMSYDDLKEAINFQELIEEAIFGGITEKTGAELERIEHKGHSVIVFGELTEAKRAELMSMLDLGEGLGKRARNVLRYEKILKKQGKKRKQDFAKRGNWRLKK